MNSSFQLKVRNSRFISETREKLRKCFRYVFLNLKLPLFFKVREMGMKNLWKELKAIYHFTDGLDAPIIVRYCSRHQRFEWFDPCNKWGGIANDLCSLKNSFRKLFRCYCGQYHVYDVAIVEDEKVTFISFIDFISE